MQDSLTGATELQSWKAAVSKTPHYSNSEVAWLRVTIFWIKMYIPLVGFMLLSQLWMCFHLVLLGQIVNRG